MGKRDAGVSYIYTLSDPDAKQVMYVGQAIDPTKRFSQHLTCKDSSRKSNWIMALRSLSKRPQMAVIDCCSTAEIDRVEAQWINYFLVTNRDILNTQMMGGFDITHPPIKERIAQISPVRCDYCHEATDIAISQAYHHREKEKNFWIWRCKPCIDKADAWLKAHPGIGSDPDWWLYDYD